jgi:hypothetical protein
LAVPSPLGVHDGNRTADADSQTIGLGAKHAALTRQSHIVEAVFEKLPRYQRTLSIATFRFRLIATKENVPPKLAHLQLFCFAALHIDQWTWFRHG